MKKIYGMVHLSGPSAIEKAIEEIKIYEEEGLYGVIVENYHGSVNDVIYTLKAIEKEDFSIKIGINILPNEFEEAFKIASQFKVDFIQLDYVAGKYEGNKELDIEKYLILRNLNPDVKILGGVHPKYYIPVKGSILSQDLKEASLLCDEIVVTGKRTGEETSLEKIISFKLICDVLRIPLIIGAGLNPLNVREQMEYAEGGIVGSAFKPLGNTSKTVDRELVKVFIKNIK